MFRHLRHCLMITLLFISLFSTHTIRAAETVAEILQRIPGDEGEPVWHLVAELGLIGTAETLTSALQKEERPAAILALSGALLKVGEQREATKALEEMIIGAVPLSRRLEAASMLGTYGGEYAAARAGALMDDKALPEVLRVECATSLWKLTNRGSAYDVLRKIMRDGKSLRAKQNATLALGRTDRYREVAEKIKSLASVPGPVGDEARLLMMLNAKVDVEIGDDEFIARLTKEVVGKLRRFYAKDLGDKNEKEQLKPKQMATVAARAILHSIDPFNDYLDEESLKDMEEQLRAHYGGIGAWVGMREGRFTILTPMYDKPAYQAGLRPLDIIDKIGEVELRDLQLNDIIKLLKGEADTKVTVRAWRKGWREGRILTIIRKNISIPSVVSQMLPGNIGYIRINGFNEGDRREKVKGTAELLREILEDYNQRNVSGVLLDLSNNPGGLLSAAVNVSRCFIGEGKLIVSSRGKDNFYRPQDFYAEHGDPIFTKPMVVLINSGSASASEIVAGALHDHNRAKLVGQKTYGKGSVQQLIPVWATRGKTRIKLTIAKYYLPSGKCIHGPYSATGGIKPDIKAEEQTLTLAESDIRYKLLRENHEVQLWLEEGSWKRHEQAYRKLLSFDGYEPKAYPEFADLIAKMRKKYPDAAIDEELMRSELRFGIASYLRDFHGEDIYTDLQESVVLQQAIAVLGEEIGGGLPDLPVYKAILERVEKAKSKLTAAIESTLPVGNNDKSK